MQHGEKKALAAVTVTFLALMLWAVPAEAVSFRVARVSEIDYPRRVTCRQEFSVAVTFEYASRVLADVGVLEEETLRVVQSLTLISGFFGPGNVTYVFNLTAPDAPKVWRLIAATRAWWADSWFSDPNQGEKAFAVEVISEDRFWLNVTSSYVFHVDGLRYEPENDREVGILLWRGQHTVFVEPVRPVCEGVRHVFDRWSDGVQSNPRVVNLFLDIRLTALYRTQYHLTIGSEHGDPIGGGWYDQNTTAWFAILPEVKDGVLGILDAKHVFDRWEGDWSGQGPIAAIQMLSPKNVHAVWRTEQEFSPGPLSRLASFSLVLTSLLFVVRGARRRCLGRKLSFRVFGKRQIMIALTVWFIMNSVAITPSSAGGSVSTVKVGETYWRHWENVESDTCIIWLGGGIEGPPLIVNPYWLESYNTMQFVQDLARYYSVLTLERGSSTIFQTALNRTIRAEFYPSELIHNAKSWATTAGYRYVYLVGYSVGGIAAAREATITDKEGWSSPNGIVLITVPLEQFIPYANLLKANHLILYGTEMTKSYIDSGRIFFESTPDRGQYSDHWLHKEFRIINDVAHEVWTIAKTGRYDSEAITVTINFIEQSKSLQLERQKPLLRNASNLTSSQPRHTQVRVALTEAAVPEVVPFGEIFCVSATIHWQKPSKAQGWITLYSSEKDTILSVRQLSDLENGSARVTLLARAPNDNAFMNLDLLVLCSDNDRWAIPAGNYSLPVRVLVRDTVDLIIKTTVPGIQMRINGILHTSNNIGVVKVGVVRGHSVVEAPPIAYLTDRERAIFEGWRDGPYPVKRTVKVTETCQIEAFFRLQYYVSASSEVGHVAGEGWYDQNATATITVFPPMMLDHVNETLAIYKFNGWSLDPKERSVALALAVTKPTEAQARWLKVTYEEKEDFAMYASEVLASLSLFVVSVAFSRRKHDMARGKIHAGQREHRLSIFQGDSIRRALRETIASYVA